MRFLSLILICSFCGALQPRSHAVASRIKDLVMISGVRENQLVGYGLVVGLAGDGDKNPVYTIQSIANMLQKFGVTVPAATLAAKNVAAVIVTAEIRPFMKSGSRLDITVSSMGDAKSLQGGVLLQTPLQGADGKTYAVAQGALVLGGFSAGTSGAGGANVQKNHPTVALVTGGALVEKEIPMQIVQNNHIDLLLREPDFTSAARMAQVINGFYPELAHAMDLSTIRVQLPKGWEDSPVDFIARIESLEVTPDTSARIIINERTGTIVATSNIKISSCAVAHGELTITISSTVDVSQPAPFSQGGTTTAVPRTDTKVNEPKASLITLPDMPSIEKVAAGLNALGVTPRDIMAIFQAMKQAGALQAELVLK